MSTSSDILLHCCCGPCSTATIDFLQSNGFSVKPIFFNPNIKPAEEFEKRLEAFKIVCSVKKLEPIIIEEDSYISKTDTSKCGHCFSFRFGKVSEVAKELGYSSFTTSLLISPYQKHELLKNTGLSFDGFRYFDFRPLYDQSRVQAVSLGIYRQKYCGCLQSKVEAKWLSKRSVEARRIKAGPVSEWKPDWVSD